MGYCYGEMMEGHDKVLISLRQIIRAIDLHSKKIERLSGLTGPQLLLLQVIGRNGSLSAGALAREVSLSQATVTTILDRLEVKGYLQRVRSQADKRRVELSLTADGEAVLASAPALMQEGFIRRFNELGEWEQNLIISSLQRVAAMMNANELDAAPLLDSTDALVTRHDGQVP